MSRPFSLTLTHAPRATLCTLRKYIMHTYLIHTKNRFIFLLRFFSFAAFVFSFALFSSFYIHTHIRIIYYYYYYPFCVLASIVRCEQHIFIIIPKFKFTRSSTQSIYCTFGGGDGVWMPTNATLSSMLCAEKVKSEKSSRRRRRARSLARSLVCFSIAVGDDVVDVDDGDDAWTDPLPVSVGSCLFFIYFRCLTWLQIAIGYMCRTHMEIRVEIVANEEMGERESQIDVSSLQISIRVCVCVYLLPILFNTALPKRSYKLSITVHRRIRCANTFGEFSTRIRIDVEQRQERQTTLYTLHTSAFAYIFLFV